MALGDKVFIMTNVHIGHYCQIGDDAIIVTGVGQSYTGSKWGKVQPLVV